MQVSRAMAKYPDLFPFSASEHAFTALPQDVKCITSQSLVQAGALAGDQWLVVAGWECQDLSAAGKGKGLDGPRSSTFFDTVRIVGALQQLQTSRPPAYLLENAPLQHNWRSKRVRITDYARVVDAIGNPITFDAAQFNSRAHRVRNYWTNLADVNQFTAVLNVITRGKDLCVDDILDPNRTAQVLVSYPESRAFRDGKSGQVWDSNQGRLVEPNPDERERALGYETGTTDHPDLTPGHRHVITGRCMDPDLTPGHRHVITGRCMDRNALCNLLAICKALHAHRYTPSSHSLVKPSDIWSVHGTSGSSPEAHLAWHLWVFTRGTPFLPFTFCQSHSSTRSAS